jgi:hypothetical protein
MNTRLFWSLILSFFIGFGPLFGQTTVRPPVPSNAPLKYVAPKTNGAGTNTIAANQLPPQIAALGSEALLFLYSLATAKTAEVWLYSEAQVGDYIYYKLNLSGSTTMQEISKTLQAANLKIQLSGVADVGIYVRTYDATNTMSLSGGDFKSPKVAKAGGLETLALNVNLELAQDTLILWRGLRSVRMTTYYDNGSIKQSGINLPIEVSGFRFPSYASGKVLLEITDQDGNIKLYDLRKSAPVMQETLAVSASFGGRNLVSIENKNEMILVPQTIGGIGEEVYGEATYTITTDLNIAGRTTENKSATSFLYRQTDSLISTDWKPNPVLADANGMAVIKGLTPGKWQFLPIFPAAALRPTEYTYYDNGGGKGTIGGSN